MTISIGGNLNCTAFNCDISDLSVKLYQQSIELITCFEVLEHNANSHVVSETTNADHVRVELLKKRLLIPLWLSFSIGYELLFKAVLARHQALTIKKTGASQRKSTIAPVLAVRRFVQSSRVSDGNNDYLHCELNVQGITNLYDFSTGSLGPSVGNLKKLVEQKLITVDERVFLNDATQLLLDLRRNVDAHTFYALAVGGSIEGDLKNVYLPAINLLLDVYHRPVV
jgi:hypothetical protein